MGHIGKDITEQTFENGIKYEPTELERKVKKQRGRIYHRLVSGMYYNRGLPLRFMTVTSAPDSPNLRDSWRELKRRIIKDYGSFEYFCVFTDEGYGVIHCVYAGDYIPFLWLQETWKQIHGAFHVNIKLVRVYNATGLAGYFLCQYVRNQNAVRWISQSRNWVYPGYMNDWRKLKRESKKRGASFNQLISAWHLCLDAHRDNCSEEIRTDELGG